MALLGHQNELKVRMPSAKASDHGPLTFGLTPVPALATSPRQEPSKTGIEPG